MKNRNFISFFLQSECNVLLYAAAPKTEEFLLFPFFCRLRCSSHSAKACNVVPIANKQTNNKHNTLTPSTETCSWKQLGRHRWEQRKSSRETDRHWNRLRLAGIVRANASERLESQSRCLTETEHHHLESALQRVAQAASLASVPLCTRLPAQHLRSCAHVAAWIRTGGLLGRNPCDSPHSAVSVRQRN